ncbi:MAG: hypothetical protein LBB53_02095 [Prevotellaceae bacterium]|jgi:MFS family permease|nr:hypothetical protein [Prevotellaceae bacterium]
MEKNKLSLLIHIFQLNKKTNIMEPQITISEKLFKRLLIMQVILAGILLAFISFIWDIYKDFNENAVTLFSINMALIKSISVGIAIFAVNLLYYLKRWRKKIIEEDKTEKTKLQKVFPIIISICAAIGLFCITLLLLFNHWRAANIVLCGGGLFFLAVIIIILVIKKRQK